MFSVWSWPRYKEDLLFVVLLLGASGSAASSSKVELSRIGVDRPRPGIELEVSSSP